MNSPAPAFVLEIAEVQALVRRLRTFRQFEELSSLPGPIHLAVGFFDGVHLGHQQVIRHAQSAAEADGGTPVVVTFDPHPVRVLRPQEAPRLLTSTRHKELILQRLGVAHLLEIEFTPEFAALSADQFVHLLRSHSQPLGSICVGEDWGFGRGRSGTVASLRLFGERDGFAVCAVEPVKVAGETVSSTRIRQAVEAGQFDIAKRLLGREYAVLGQVVTGRQMGRKLGFPTANLAVEAEQLPPVGVYAVWANSQDVLRPGVANLGFRPTVCEEARERTLEVHLFDFSGDLYGTEMEVRFAGRLREEMRLPSLDALKLQISEDCRQARLMLGLNGPEQLELAEATE